jgi:hypothetical protein
VAAADAFHVSAIFQPPAVAARPVGAGLRQRPVMQSVPPVQTCPQLPQFTVVASDVSQPSDCDVLQLPKLAAHDVIRHVPVAQAATDIGSWQVVWSGASGFEQMPSAGLQVPGTWH